ncbi:MAG TPA: CDP-alcohol phosphatidyltransferase family protein [Candidatus Eisenbacteria bacterium]|nr:CDP-alcohol phosphatidyltransferase family protein [Candidatus Eisenbacteria bacterium]
MASVYDFKPRFQNRLRPAVDALVRAGVRPNHLTLAALAGSIAIGALLPLARSRPLVLLMLPGWLLARMALNAMDGMAAREHGLHSALGAVLNELGDVLSDVALYLPLATLEPALLWPAVAFALGAMLTEFAGVLAQALSGRRRYDGPMGKSDRALLIGVLGLITTFVPRTLRGWPLVLALAALLTLATAVRRLAPAVAAPAAR